MSQTSATRPLWNSGEPDSSLASSIELGRLSSEHDTSRAHEGTKATPPPKVNPSTPGVPPTSSAPSSPTLKPAKQPTISAGQLNASPPSRSTIETLKAWQGELIAAIMAVIIMVAEIVLFAHYDNEFLFTKHKGLTHTATWPFSFKINAAFALTNAFIDAALAFITASCIGQLRWHWFRNRAHGMDWLDIMTNARGPPGAMRMLFKKGMYRQYATVGAIGILLLLFTGFFTQQAVNLSTRPYPLDGLPFGGRVPIQTAYIWYSKGVTTSLEDTMPTTDMIAGIQSGFDSITTVASQYAAGNLASCQGTKCLYGEYRTLGVCGTCSTGQLAVNNPCADRTCTSNDYYTLQHPHGLDLSLAATSALMNITSDTDYPVSPDLVDSVGPLIARTTALLHHHNLMENAVVATECAAWWCVKTYTANMTNGTLHEHHSHSWTNQSEIARTTGASYTSNITLVPPGCHVDSTTMAVPEDCRYWYARAQLLVPPSADLFLFVLRVGPEAHRGIQNFLATTNKYVFGSPFLTGVGTTVLNSSTFNVTSLPVATLLQPTDDRKSYPALLKEAYEDMAKSMTVVLRDTRTAGPAYPGWQYGLSFSDRQAFKAEWPWLTLPLFVLAATLVFLGVTIWLSRNDEIWKSSAMALMFHSFDDADRQALKDLNTAQAMARNTRDLVVQLEQGPSGQWIFKAKRRKLAHGEKYDAVHDNGPEGLGHGVEFLAAALDP